MKKIFITLFIVLNSIIAYCQHPFKQDLGSIAQITFPDTPTVEFPGGEIYYIYRNSINDLYVAQVINLNRINPDSINLKKPDHIYFQFMNTVLRPLKGEMLRNSKIEVGKIKGFSFDYKCTIKGGTYYGYQHAFLLKDALVSYSLLTPDSLQHDNKKMTSFFSTFVLTPQRAADLDKKSSISAGVLIIGSVIFWSLIIMLIIKRSKKKKIYTWPDDNRE